MPKHALTLYRDRRRWTESDAREVLTALDGSGLSVAAFAAREGFDVQRLYWWRHRLGVAATGHLPAAGFVEITPEPSATEHVEIALLSGRILRVPAKIVPATLRRLVEVLEQDRTC